MAQPLQGYEFASTGKRKMLHHKTYSVLPATHRSAVDIEVVRICADIDGNGL
jgi:hypothetical protein